MSEGSSTLSLSYDPKQPPLLLFAVAQLLGLDSQKLTFCPCDKQQAEQQQLLLTLQQQDGKGYKATLTEIDAAKQIAFSTSLGQTVRMQQSPFESLLPLSVEQFNCLV